MADTSFPSGRHPAPSRDRRAGEGDRGTRPQVNPLFLREESLREAMGLLFFVYRDFIAKPDEILEPLGLGRAHHRILYFVGRSPGLNVGELLDVLKITKQSLSRVLKDLMAQGYVEQRKSSDDGRVRRLYLTETGTVLERDLVRAQSEMLIGGFSKSGAEAVAGFRDVLLALSSSDDHQRLGVRDEP